MEMEFGNMLSLLRCVRKVLVVSSVIMNCEVPQTMYIAVL